VDEKTTSIAVAGGVGLALCCGLASILFALGFGGIAGVVAGPWVIVPAMAAGAGVGWWWNHRRACACGVDDVEAEEAAR